MYSLVETGSQAVINPSQSNSVCYPSGHSEVWKFGADERQGSMKSAQATAGTQDSTARPPNKSCNSFGVLAISPAKVSGSSNPSYHKGTFRSLQ